jgi:hypothetical protein
VIAINAFMGFPMVPDVILAVLLGINKACPLLLFISQGSLSMVNPQFEL